MNSFIRGVAGHRVVQSHQNKHKKVKSRRDLKARIKRMKKEASKVRKDQKCIKEEQREMRHKLEEIKGDCKFITNEVKEITQISELTRRRLELMFMILEARKHKDFVKANILVRSLRLLLVTTTTSD